MSKFHVCVIALFSIFFILWTKPQDAVSSSEDGDTITIATSKSLTATLLIVAAQNHLFKKNGVGVRLKYYASGGKGFKAMLDGDVNIAGVAETPLMHAGLMRKNFKIFTTLMATTNDPKIIFSDGLRWTGKPDDLSGKIIGTTRIGQSAHFFLYLFLLKHGISISDVNVVHDAPDRIIEKLQQGEIHGASLFEPYTTRAGTLIQNKAYIVSEPGLYSKTFNLVSTQPFLDENQEKIKRILNALIEAENILYESPDPTLAALEKEFNIHGKIIEQYLNDSTFEVSLFPSLLTSLYEEAIWAVKYGLTKKTEPPDYAQYIYPWILKAVHPDRMRIADEVKRKE